MQKALIGKKIGMTQIFDEKGNVVPVTVVEAGPCTVVMKKTIENDGYEAVQLGFGDVKVQRVNKPMMGHFKKADVAPKKTLKEFKLEGDLNVGDTIKADIFAAGDKVDVAGAGFNNCYGNYVSLCIENLCHTDFFTDKTFLHFYFLLWLLVGIYRLDLARCLVLKD